MGKKRANIVYWRPEAVRFKYQYLVPSNLVVDPLATSEFCWLDTDGNRIRHEMESGNDILKGWPQGVEDKYGYLRPRVDESGLEYFLRIRA